MNRIITRNYINSLEVKEENQLCNCNCNLEVFKELTKEHEKKLDELDKKFMPYRFETRFNIAYCKNCDSFYLIKTNYEASSKIDFEDIEFIYKKDYFEASDYIKKLEDSYVNDDTHSIYVDSYIVRIIKYTNNENFTIRITSIEDTVKHYEYIKNQKFCYSCDNRMILAKYQIKCLCNNEIHEANYVCDKYRNRFDDEE